MIYNYPYLRDKDFLKSFDKNKLKQQFAKIIVLDWNENILQDISGKILNGTINVDGSSAMRRTASLTIVANEDNNDLTNLNNLISINKKIELQIGFTNFSNKYLDYPIIWFPQGVYIINAVSISLSTEGILINLTLHDKMALLNGQCGGVLPAPITFHQKQDEDNLGNITVSKPTIKQIIKELIHHWGGEPERNIIINNLNDEIPQVLRWNGENNQKLFVHQDAKVATIKEHEIYQKVFLFSLQQTYKNIFTTNTPYVINKNLFPTSNSVLQYLIKNDLALEINNLSTIVTGLTDAINNYNKVLTNFEAEEQSLNEAKNKLNLQLTTSPQQIYHRLKQLSKNLELFYNQLWYKPYAQGFIYYSDINKKTNGKEILAIRNNLGKINLLKKENQKEKQIQEIIDRLTLLRSKVNKAQSYIGAKKTFSWKDSKNVIHNEKDYPIKPIQIAAWLCASKNGFKIENGTETIYFKNNSKSYARIGYTNSVHPKNKYQLLTNSNIPFINIMLFTEEAVNESRHHYYYCMDELKQIYNQVETVLQIKINRTFYNNLKTSFNVLLKNNQKSKWNEETTEKMLNKFLHSCDWLIAQLNNIQQDYNTNIKAWNYISTNAFKQKIFQSINSSTIKLTYDEMIEERLTDLINLANNLTRTFPNPNNTTESFNLRDEGKYRINNSGTYIQKKASERKKIKKQNKYYVSKILNDLKTSLQSLDFTNIKMHDINANIKKIIVEYNENIVKFDSAKEKIYFKHLSFFEKCKNLQPQIDKDTRKIINEQIKDINQRLQKIENSKRSLPKACNQALKKWCNINLQIYQEITNYEDTKKKKEVKLANLKNAYKELKKRYTTTSNISYKTLNNITKAITDASKIIQSANNNIPIHQFNALFNINSNNNNNDILITQYVNLNKYEAEVTKMHNQYVNIIPVLNAQEEEILRLEKEIEEMDEKEISANTAAKQAISEITQKLNERITTLQTLQQKLEDDTIKILKNFNTDNFMTAFAQGALEQDRLITTSNKVFGTIASSNNKITANEKNIILNKIFNDITINANNKKNFWNIFYNLWKENKAKIKQYQYGEDVGYNLVDFTYPGQLVSNAGDTIVSVLNKITDILGNYEYFYDIEGRFIFQEIHNYLNNSYSKEIIQQMNKNRNFELNYFNNKDIYDFSDGDIIQSYNNTPQYQQIKNDFLIWGERTTIDGKKIPIRYHLAIDSLPEINTVYFFDVPFNTTKKVNQKIDLPSQGNNKYIYYVAEENTFYSWEDTNKYIGYKKISDLIINNSKCHHFINRKSFPNIGEEQHYYYDQSTNLLYQYLNNQYIKTYTYRIKKCTQTYTGVGQGIEGIYYYTPANGEQIYTWNNSTKAFQLRTDLKPLKVNHINTQLFIQGYNAEIMGLDSNDYYVELKTQWPKIWDLWQNKMYNKIINNPSGIDFFLNFLSSSSLTQKFSITNIGKRTKTISNNTINCIFEPSCSQIMFLNETDKDIEEQKNKIQNYNKNYLSNYKILNVSSQLYSQLSLGGILRSAYEEIRSELYQYITYNEQVSLTMLPIYYLQPNTRVYIHNSKIGIEGSFIIKNFSIPLKEGNMTLNCSKAISRI